MEIVCLLACGLFSYLIGSVPHALVISKIFFKMDIRDYGSHNAGGTNAGRVMGKKVGLIVILLDALKIPLIFLINIFIITSIFKFPISEKIYTYYQLFSAFIATLGHCYPIYCGFRGGKAVSCTAGTIAFSNFILLPIGLLFFFGTLFKSKIVSISSIIGSFVVAVLSFIPFVSHGMWFYLQYDFVYPLTITMIFLLLLIRHRENIIKLKNHQENKVKWIK